MQGFFADYLHVVGGDNLLCALVVVGAEDEQAAVLVEEAVHVGDVDVSLAEGFHGVGCTSGLVVNSDYEDFAEGYGHAGTLQFVAGTHGLAADEAVDAVVGGVGDCGGNNLNVSLFESIEDFDECT